ncbi:MAG: Hsp20/alpha crystallin family protein [Planctomycetota bacterium]
MTNATHKNRLSHLVPGSLAEVDNLVEQFFGHTGSWASAWRAPASLWEADDRLHLELDAPGVARDGVDVTFDKGVLTVKLDRPAPEDRKYHHNERGFGSLKRTVALPDTVDAETLEAELKDGVLHVSIEKRPEAQPKRVELK